MWFHIWPEVMVRMMQMAPIPHANLLYKNSKLLRLGKEERRNEEMKKEEKKIPHAFLLYRNSKLLRLGKEERRNEERRKEERRKEDSPRLLVVQEF